MASPSRAGGRRRERGRAPGGPPAGQPAPEGAQAGNGRSGSWLWPILLAATLFIASGQSDVAAPAWAHADKVFHVLVYGLLATLAARTQRPQRYWLGVVFASVYGLFDEFRQTLTPGRMMEMADWAADTGGALLAVGLYAAWPAYRRVLELDLRRCRPGLPSRRRRAQHRIE